MAQVLDGYAYPLDPTAGGSSGVRQTAARADVPTFGGNVSLYWDPVWPDTVVWQEWEQIEADQFDALLQRFTAGGGGRLYTWSPGDGHRYEVEITSLDGRPYKGQTYIRVVMQLKVHRQLA